MPSHVVRQTELKFVGSSHHFVGEEQDVAVSIFFVSAKPGRGAPLHVHPYDEILTIQQGLARLVIGDEIFEAGAGYIAVVKAGTPHGFINIGHVTLNQVDVHLHPHFEQTNLEPTETSIKAGLQVPDEFLTAT